MASPFTDGLLYKKDKETMVIQVTYKIHSDKPLDPEKKAQGIALGQTTDTWTPNARSGLKKLEKHRGQVVAARELPQTNGSGHAYELTIGYPPANTENDIPSLLTMVFGKISLDGKIRLETIAFPASYLKGKGPKFGIEGLRKRVGEPHQPLTMAIFKPGVGLTPKELSEMFYELAMGGLHLVKDDEILPDLSICPVDKRLEACLKAGFRARQATGRRTLYAVNLTGKASQLQAKARRLAKLGAECFLLNVLSYGFGVLEELKEVGVPIMAHPALAGGLCGSPDTGMSYQVVLGSLMRLGGADIVLFPSSYGTVALPEIATRTITRALVEPSPLKRVFPGPSAGIHPGLVPRILKDYGKDVIINAGGGVHGHPQGARAGALAFQQAVIGQTQAPELAQALALWGHG
jgi:2,3-diketo-5-methylthiopentyl-1-phosphate enolase